MKLLEGNVPTSMINPLLEVMDSNTLSANSLHHLRSTVLNQKHGRDEKESTGTTLLRLLKEKEGCDFVYMTRSYVQAMQRVRLHKRYRTKPVSSAKEFQKKPAVTSDGDIICPKRKTTPIKKNPAKTQNSLRVPWANNKKKKTKKHDDIIWVHDEVYAEEGSDPARYIKTVVDALTIGEDKILLAVAWTAKEG